MFFTLVLFQNDTMFTLALPSIINTYLFKRLKLSVASKTDKTINKLRVFWLHTVLTCMVKANSFSINVHNDSIY